MALIGVLFLIFLAWILALGWRNAKYRPIRNANVQAMKDEAARLREQNYHRGVYVGVHSDSESQLYVLDAYDRCWHMAKRLYPDGAYMYCTRRIGLENLRIHQWAKSWADLRWKNRGTATDQCDACAMAVVQERRPNG